jgi:pimeloyl-ACP methyl ester carboxylesterase
MPPLLLARRSGLLAAGTVLFALTGCMGIAPPASPARHRVLLQDGPARIDVIVEGRGPAVVLLPSSQRDSEDFDDLAHRLAASGFKVLRPQPRGMGRSTGPMQDLSLRVLAADVAATVRQLGDGRAVLVGHAFGHFVARVADLDHPQLVRGVVVAGGAARTFPAGMAESLAVASDPAQPREARLRGLRHAFFAPGNDPTSWLEGWHPGLRQWYRQAGAVPAKDLWWPVSHAPILDLQGAEDPWRPPSTRNELKDVLGAKVTVQVIARASHALIPEQPEAVTQAIVRWIATLPP